MKSKRLFPGFWAVCLIFLLLSVLIMPSTVAAADTAKVFRWKCPTAYTTVMPDFKLLQEAFDNLKVISQGRLIITAYPDGALVRGLDIYDSVKTGTIEIGCGWPNWWIGKNPAWNIINDQPFGFRKKEAFLMWYYHDEGMKFANELANPDGMMWLPGLFTSTQTGAFCRTNIRSLADAKGKKFRIGAGLHMKVLEKHGIAPVNMAAQEIYGALERGVVDMVEWLTPATDYPLKFHEVAKYILAPAWWQCTGLSDFLINMKKFNELPPDLQAMLKTSLRDVSHYAAFNLLNLDRIYLKKFIEEGCTINRWPEEDLKVLEKDTLEVMQEYADKYPMFKKIWESQKKFIKNYYEYEAWMKF